MAHFLMLESWVGASGNLLPPLLKSLGHTYMFVTRKPAHYQNPLSSEKHMVFRQADEVLVTETNDVDTLIKVLEPYRFDAVITVCDYYIEIARRVADALNIPCPFPQNVKTAREKHLMRMALDKAGLSNPKYRITSGWQDTKDAAEEIGYPVVIKPVDLASSAFVRLAKNCEDLKEAYDHLENFPLNFREQKREHLFLVEEFMTGEEVSVESVSYKGNTEIIGVTDKSVTGLPYFIEDGHMFPAKLETQKEEELKLYVKNVLDAVGYDNGVAHTEVKLTRNGPRIVEINPRTAGNYIVELIERVKGINVLRAYTELALGQKPDLNIKDTGVESAAIKFLVPQHGGRIAGIEGVKLLENNAHISRCRFEDCAGKTIDDPIDNACYLGHIVTEDTEGRNARDFAEEAMKNIKLIFSV
ncbi:MAG: ATP-grasp domain-containing protein [Clostridiales bacterium]|nr:ATP-grasp domain-containing protein [Clostridiales bacterium]